MFKILGMKLLLLFFRYGNKSHFKLTFRTSEKDFVVWNYLTISFKDYYILNYLLERVQVR